MTKAQRKEYDEELDNLAIRRDTAIRKFKHDMTKGLEEISFCNGRERVILAELSKEFRE